MGGRKRNVFPLGALPCHLHFLSYTTSPPPTHVSVATHGVSNIAFEPNIHFALDVFPLFAPA